MPSRSQLQGSQRSLAAPGQDDAVAAGSAVEAEALGTGSYASNLYTYVCMYWSRNTQVHMQLCLVIYVRINKGRSISVTLCMY